MNTDSYYIHKYSEQLSNNEIPKSHTDINNHYKSVHNASHVNMFTLFTIVYVQKIHLFLISEIKTSFITYLHGDNVVQISKQIFKIC